MMEMQLFLIHNTDIPLASPLLVQIPTRRSTAMWAYPYEPQELPQIHLL